MAKKNQSDVKVPKIIELPSGAYFCQLRLNGQSISITDSSRDVVFAKAVAIKAGVIKAKKNPENITLRQACSKFIELKRPRLSPSTIVGYESIRDTKFQDIMDKRLCDLNRRVIDRSIANECSRTSRRGKQLSAKTVKNSFMFIASVLHYFEVDTDLTVTLPEVKRKIVSILPPEELMPIIIGSNVELPCLLAMWFSLSMSEIKGLTKSKSLVNGKLAIVETVIRIKGKDVRKEGGKEEQRTRVLSIPPYIQSLIDNVSGDSIVPTPSCTIVSRFAKLLKNNQLPHMSFHKLRHVNASVMAMLNIPTIDAQERGGWKTDHTMKQVYTHSFTEHRKTSDEKIDNYFNSLLPAKQP